MIQQAVAQVVAGLDQRTPGLGSADAVDAEAPPLLERADGGLGGRPIGAVRVGGGLVTGRAQARLEVPDRLARRSLAQQGLDATGYRNSASS